MYLIKEIETGHGLTLDCWDVNNVTITATAAGVYSARGNVSLYNSNSDRLAGKKILENCQFHFEDLTQEEIDGNTLAVIYAKLVASVMSEDGNGNPAETNIYHTSFSGDVCFVGCTITP